MKNWFVALVAGCLVFGFLAIPAISQDAPKDDSVGADSTEDPKAFAAEKATFRALKALRKHSSGLAGTGKEEDAELSLHYHAGFCFVVPYDLASRDKKTYEALAIETSDSESRSSSSRGRAG